MMLATTALIMPITPAAVTVGTPHWTAELKTQQILTKKNNKKTDTLVLNGLYLCP